MNVCAVRTLTETVGLEKGYKYLENFGFTTLVNNDPNYPGMSDIAQLPPSEVLQEVFTILK